MNDDFENNIQSENTDGENNNGEYVNSAEYNYSAPDYSAENENGNDNKIPNSQNRQADYNNQSYNQGYNQGYYNRNNQYGNNSYQNNNPYSNNGYSDNNMNNNPYSNGNINNPPYSQPNNNGPYQVAKKKNNDSGKKVFIGIIIGVAVIVTIVLLISTFTGKSKDNSKESVTNGDVDSLVIEDSDNATVSNATEVYEKVKKTNVGILVYENNSLYTEGSGVIAKEDNNNKYTYIITCAHVISEGDAFVVQTYDETKYKATVVGYDTRTDIGVLRIEASGLDIATFGDSSKLKVGQTVYAIGNPGGSEFSGSFTAGIISAIDRPISSSTGYEMECIQHDAAINPGNSGGALVNENGEIIGINSMKIASSSYEGMGFSVPTTVVTDVFDSIVTNGYVTGRAKLGITYAAASNYQSYGMYVTVKGLPSGSIIIASISDDSALKNTDAQVGDLITKVNGKEMTTTGVLSEMIENASVGDTLTLTLVRIDTTSWTQKEFEVKVTLVEDKGTTTTSDDEDDSSSGNSGSYGYGNGNSGSYGYGNGNSGSSSYDSFEDFYNQFFGSGN